MDQRWIVMMILHVYLRSCCICCIGFFRTVQFITCHTHKMDQQTDKQTQPKSFCGLRTDFFAVSTMTMGTFVGRWQWRQRWQQIEGWKCSTLIVIVGRNYFCRFFVVVWSGIRFSSVAVRCYSATASPINEPSISAPFWNSAKDTLSAL